MDSKKPQKRENRKRRKTTSKVLSVAGALALGAGLPSVASANTNTVAERITRIRNAFANSQATPNVPEVKIVRADAAEKELVNTERNFADFMNYFANFKDFSDFKDFHDFHDFKNFKDFWNYIAWKDNG